MAEARMDIELASLGGQLELVWARGLRLAGEAGQLDYPDLDPIYAIKVEWECK